MREEIEIACRYILSSVVYDALKKARTPLPRILSMAGETAFIRRLEGAEVEAVRGALILMDAGGYLPEPEEETSNPTKKSKDHKWVKDRLGLLYCDTCSLPHAEWNGDGCSKARQSRWGT